MKSSLKFFINPICATLFINLNGNRLSKILSFSTQSFTHNFFIMKKNYPFQSVGSGTTLFLILTILSLNSITAQNCPALPFTNNSEILIEGYHSTMVRTETGYSIWGDMALPDGTTTGTPQDITPANGYNYSGMILLGTLGDNEQSGANPQNFILSTGGLYVWGRENAVVDGTLTSSSSFQLLTVTAPTGDPATGMPSGVNPTDIQYMSASKGVLVMLTNSGDVYVMADDDFEVFGDGSTAIDNNWHQATVSNIVNIKVTEKAIFAMDSGGQYFTWGTLTALGDGTAFASRNSPTLMTNPFAGLANSLAVTASGDSGHTMSYYALNPADNKIYTFGENADGQLGIGNTTNQLSWVIVQNSNNTGDLENVNFLSAADNSPGHPAAGAITSDGTPYFWGDNSSNMLTGTGGQYNSPRIPDGFIQGTEFASYIGISGHYILVKKFGEDRPCFGGHKSEGNVGDGDTGSGSFVSLDCGVFPLLDYCFSSTTDSDLVTSKIVDDNNPQVGDTITFSLSVSNNGPEDAMNVQLTDNLPVGLTFVGTANNLGGTVNSYDSGTGLWTIGDLSNGNSASIEIIATVDAGTEGTAIINAISGPATADNLADPVTNTDDLTETINVQPDTDGDGIGDMVDLDDDNDGIPDTEEDSCAVLATFDIDSEGWYTINNNDNAQVQSNPASHSSDGVTSSDGCTITATGISNQNIAGTSPTGTNYVVDSDPNGGANYLRSSNAGGIDHSNLIGGTFQYDAYNYKVGVTGNPGWVPSPTGNIVIYDTMGNSIEASFPLTAAQLTNWENGIWNTFSIPVDDANWSGTQQDLIDVLSDYDYVSILMEFVSASNTGNCNDVEYYAIDNVVFASSAGYGSSCDFDGDGITNSLDLDSDNDGISDIVEAGGTDSDRNGMVDGFTDGNDDGLDDTVATTPLPLPNSDNNLNDLADYLDIDADDDGLPDNIEGQPTASYVSPSGMGSGMTDANNNGVDDNYENGTVIGLLPENTDGDTNPDYIDTDSDDDLIDDLTEGGRGTFVGTDTDADGLDDGFEGGNNNDPEDVNDEIDDPTTLPDVQMPGGNVDYRQALDNDGDGINDDVDLDDDNDGIPDTDEGNGLTDTDGDGIPDSLDLDSDNDGVPDIIEAGGIDTDGDGHVDYPTPGDPTSMVDTNNDGLEDGIAAATLPDLDSDNDGIKDRLDLDSDNDGIADVTEAGGTDTDGDGILDAFVDADDDGFADSIDTDDDSTPGVGDQGAALPNPDTDNDGVDDRIDVDSDNDGITDVTEAGGTDADGDGRIDGFVDADNDGFADSVDTDDNTTPTALDGSGTPLPKGDFDNDGQPNYLDIDSDNDGITDATEAGGLDTDGNGEIDGFTDADGDGLDDATATSPLPIPNSDMSAIDGPDYLDIDADDDGLPDNIEAQPTVGYISPNGTSATNGLDNAYTTGFIPEDTDGDLIPDYLDPDSDNDGVNDLTEGGRGTLTGTDSDADGLVDGFEGANTNDPYDVNDEIDDPATLPDNQLAGGDVDYRQGFDSDGDGVTDDQEVADGTNPNNPCDFVIASITEIQTGDYLVADCDGDGVTNGTEIVDGTNPEDPCAFVVANVTLQPSGDYLISDCDGDGVTNGTELTDGTDPANPCDFLEPSVTLDRSGDYLTADCDMDTIPNGQEITDGTNPNDPCSSKGGTPPAGVPCDVIINNDLVGPQVDEGFFRIINIESYANNTVRIYNRWGVLVFETKGYDNGGNAFRGLSNGRATIQQNEALPAGVYFYIVEYENNGEVKVKDGYLYVAR